MVRVPQFREHARELNHILRQSLVDQGYDPDQSNVPRITDADLADSTISWVISARDFAPHFLDKDWQLLEAPTSNTIYISDNPVVLDYNQGDRGPYRGIGIGTLGAELYLPLSGSFVLGMLCPSIRMKINQALERQPALRPLPPHIAEARRRLEQFRDQLRDRTTVAIAAENVERLNSLQVRNATRYVYSASANFDLVRSMIAEHPEMRAGRKLERG
jgi:hypothetical protein